MTDTEYRQLTATRVSYEWDWEEMDGADADSDILEHWFGDGDSIPQRPACEHARLVLVRNVWSQADGITSRHWAYVQNGQLPSVFSNAWEKPTAINVPQRFHAQYNKWKMSQ